jgi:hypothetical protein
MSDHTDPLLDELLPEQPPEISPGGVLLELSLPPGLLDRTLVGLDEVCRELAQDARLADHLEGLLDPSQGAELEAELVADSLARDRRRALDAILPADADLPPLELPAGLEECVLSRLEEEGLVGAPTDEQRLPSGLLEATLTRLEDEGLVAPSTSSRSAPPAGALLPFPSRAWLAVAAALLLGLGLGIGWSPRGASPATSDDQLVSLQRQLDEARQALRGEPEPSGEQLVTTDPQPTRPNPQLQAALAEAQDLRHDLTTLGQERDVLTAQLDRLDAELTGVRSELAQAGQLRAEAEAARTVLADALDSTRTELAQATSLAEELTDQVAQARQAQAATEAQLVDTRAHVRELEGLVTDRRGDDAVIEVSFASQIECWDFERGGWVEVDVANVLAPGTIVHGGRRGVLRSQARRFRVDDGLYVVAPSGQLEPLPDQGQRRTAARPSAPSTTAGDLDAARVQELITASHAGAPALRTWALGELIKLWQRYGDPGRDAFDLVADATARASERPTGWPTTPEAWEAWWLRVIRSRG